MEKDQLLALGQALVDLAGGGKKKRSLGIPLGFHKRGNYNVPETTYVFVQARSDKPYFLFQLKDNGSGGLEQNPILNEDGTYADCFSGRLIDIEYRERTYKQDVNYKTGFRFDISPESDGSEPVVLEFGRTTITAQSLMLAFDNISEEDIRNSIVTIEFNRSEQEAAAVFTTLRINGRIVQKTDPGVPWSQVDFDPMDAEMYRKIKKANGLLTRDELEAEIQGMLHQLGWSDIQLQNWTTEHRLGEKLWHELRDWQLGKVLEALKNREDGEAAPSATPPAAPQQQAPANQQKKAPASKPKTTPQHNGPSPTGQPSAAAQVAATTQAIPVTRKQMMDETKAWAKAMEWDGEKGRQFSAKLGLQKRRDDMSDQELYTLYLGIQAEYEQYQRANTEYDNAEGF